MAPVLCVKGGQHVLWCTGAHTVSLPVGLWVQVAGWYGRQVTPQQELCFLREAVRKAWAVDSAAHTVPLRKRVAFLRAAVRAQPFSPTLHTYLKGKAVLALARFRGAHAGWPALRWEPGSVAASHSSPPGPGPS